MLIEELETTTATNTTSSDLWRVGGLARRLLDKRAPVTAKPANSSHSDIPVVLEHAGVLNSPVITSDRATAGKLPVNPTTSSSSPTPTAVPQHPHHRHPFDVSLRLKVFTVYTLFAVINFLLVYHLYTTLALAMQLVGLAATYAVLLTTTGDDG